MPTANVEFVEGCALPTARAGWLRRALQQVPGIEEIGISVERQRVSIIYNAVLLDSDTLGELLADLGYVVRPVRHQRWNRENP